MKKNLIFCDIDGTILDGARGMDDVSAKTRHAIGELKKDNIVIIATGRNKGLLSEKITDLKPSGYILCNGAYSEIGGKAIHADYFSEEAAEAIKRNVITCGGFYFLETLERMYVNRLEDETFLEFARIWGTKMERVDLEENRKDRCLIAMIGFDDRGKFEKAKGELKGIVDLADHRVFPSCDVNIKGVSKATGVKKIIEYLDFPLEDTYAFGDAVNDLEMLESVGHPVIMANCAAELKGRGFEETGDVLDDGFYDYLLSNKLIKAF